MNGRRNFQPGDMLSFGPFSLFVAGRLLKRADEAIPLGGRALDVLIALTERAGELVSYRELISLAWPNMTVVCTENPICLDGAMESPKLAE
jgi:DNA-binding winged helix-turn-helix (wHTH) protein